MACSDIDNCGEEIKLRDIFGKIGSRESGSYKL